MHFVEVPFPIPIELLALTVNVYSVLGDRPVIDNDMSSVTLMSELGDQVTL